MGLHSLLIRPAIYWGGGIGGVPLDSHDGSGCRWWVYYKVKGDIQIYLSKLQFINLENLEIRKYPLLSYLFFGDGPWDFI